jgi:hypothetical protein
VCVCVWVGVHMYVCRWLWCVMSIWSWFACVHMLIIHDNGMSLY